MNIFVTGVTGYLGSTALSALVKGGHRVVCEQVSPRPDVRHMPIAEARKKFGTYADALALDQRVRSVRARALGLTPSLHGVAGSVARLLDEFRSSRAARPRVCA